jgi:hypothetical protein
MIDYLHSLLLPLVMRPTRAFAAVASLSCLCAATGAWAQPTDQTWVSGVGDDANPCSRTAPCKTFAGAISKTNAGGEIDALDPGGFGAVTITKAITFDGGAFASVLVSGTNGITVNAGATDVVVLRGLSFQGINAGLSAIKFNSGAALHVENCAIVGFTVKAIDFEPTANAQLFVKNSVLRNNGSATAGSGGIYVAPAVASTNLALLVTVDKSSLLGSNYGLDAAAASGKVQVTIHDTVISGNSAFGIHAEAGSEVNMERGALANNLVALQSEGSARISNVLVSDNGTGLATGGAGTISSFGNNRIAAGNVTNGAPTSTLPQQ